MTLRVLSLDSTYAELARASQKWLVVARFEIDWRRTAHQQYQVLAAVPWLRVDSGALNDGYAVAMCDTAIEADVAFTQIYGPANRARGEERERVGDMTVYAWVLTPEGTIETDNAD